MRLTTSLLNKVGDLTKKFSNLPDTYIKRSMEQVNITEANYWTLASSIDFINRICSLGVLENASRKTAVPEQDSRA